MKKLLLLLILSLFSAQSFAGSCPDGSDPVKSVSADGTYFVYNCGNTNNKQTSSNEQTSSSNTNTIITTINPVYHSGWDQHDGIRGINSHNFQFVSDSTKSRRGKQYQRFELRDGDCFDLGGWDDCANDRQRVEFTAEPFLPPKGNQCIAFSIMLDKSFEAIEPSPTALAQIHQRGGPVSYTHLTLPTILLV